MEVSSVQNEKDNVQHHTSCLPKAALKLDKIWKRKRAMKRTKLQKNQQLVNENQNSKDLASAQRKSDEKKIAYRLHRSQTSAANRTQYRNDRDFRLRQKKHITDTYRNDPAFQQRQKRRITDAYRNNPAFCLRKKEYMRRRHTDATLSQKHNAYTRAYFQKRCVTWKILDCTLYDTTQTL